MSPERLYELYSAEFKANAYATFARMRAEHPVLRQPGLDGKTNIWFITRYDLIEALLRDDRRFTRDFRRSLTAEQLAQMPQMPPIFELADSHMLNRDGDDHRRLRGLISKAFTPRIIGQLRDRIQAIADELLDAVMLQEEMDLVASYAFPLPITVIAELLGVPAADRDRFRTWSDAVVSPSLTPEDQARAATLLGEFVDYLRALFAERRQQPQDDLITALLRAEEAGDRLAENELFSTIILLIVAGHETTVGLIANGTLALLQNPAAWQRLAADPSSMATAVEELLRYDGPVERALTRWATEDVTVDGHLIRRGEPVILILGAANRDPEQFPDPDRLDLDRSTSRHLAFGRGVHYCLGAPLARLEGEIALNTLIRRLPRLRLAVAPEAIDYRLTPLFHSPAALPVAWDKADQ